MLRQRARFPLWYSLLFVALGCGARTTLTEEEFESVDARGGSKGVSSGGVNSGGASSGGNSSSSGGAGAVSSGGTSTGGFPGSGGVSTGGSAGSFGSGGTAGVAGTTGAGGGVGVGQLKEACEALCAPYLSICPNEFANPDECVLGCVEDGRQTPRKCRAALTDALYCIGSALDPSFGCDYAAEQAIVVCANQVDAYETCSDGGNPPPPPDCASVVSIGEFECSLSLYCPEGEYLVSCKFETPSQSACTCTHGATAEEFEVNASLDTACDTAVGYCG